MPELASPLVLPEFTRAMRSFASVRSLGSPFHDVVFGGLIVARRTAAEASSRDAQLEAFDALALRGELERAIKAITTECWPKADAEHRALQAQLSDTALPVFMALEQSSRAASLLASARPDSVDEHWHSWVNALQAVFTEWDRFWATADPVVTPLARVKRGRKRGAK